MQLAGVLIGLLSAQSVPSGRIEPPDELGYHIAGLNDVDGDRCADLALDDKESIWVVSGKSGRVLAQAAFKKAGRIEELGCDLDGDGVFDLVSIETSSSGGACVRSGKTLQVIRPLEPTEKSLLPRLGSIAMGDWNRDGVADIVAVDLASRPQSVVVFSGRTGQECERIPGRDGCELGALAVGAGDAKRPGDLAIAKSRTIWSILHPEDRAEVLLACHDPVSLTGSIVERRHHTTYEATLFVPDIDEDGAEDLLVVQRDECTKDEIARVAAVEGSHRDLSGIVIYSTRTHLPVRTISDSGDLINASDYVSPAMLSDIDGDGIAELGVGFDAPFLGLAFVCSGKTGTRLRTHIVEKLDGGQENISRNGHFGVSMAGLGDVDGDGMGDYAIGSSGGPDGKDVGCVSIYSGRSGKLLRVIWKRDLVGR